MYTTTATIGRNVGIMPMLPGQWDRARAELLDGMRVTAFEPLQSAGWQAYLSDSNGRGFWDGVPEDNYTVTVLHEIELDPFTYEAMRNHLKEVARHFSQEAIALIGNHRADLVPAAETAWSTL